MGAEAENVRQEVAPRLDTAILAVMGAVRLSPQTQQEHISRDELRTRLSRYGWQVNELPRDVGHDTLVHIFDQGRFSGLTFLTQTKSTNDAEMVQSATFITYRFDVADFSYWEASTPVNVLVLWDVQNHIGWWICVEDAIKDLDLRLPEWREQETTTVHFPVSNNTTDVGLRALREAIRKHSQPLVTAGRKLTISLGMTFPHDTEGRRAEQSFHRMIEHGDEVRVEGRYISKFLLPDWYQRTLDPRRPPPSELVFKPRAPNVPMPIRVTVPGSDGEDLEISYIDLRLAQRGTKSVTFKGSDPTGVIQVTWTVASELKETSFVLRFRQAPTTARKALELLRFMKAMSASPFVKITILPKNVSVSMEVPPGVFEAPPTVLIDLLERVLVVEAKCGVQFRLPSRWYPTNKDIEEIVEAHQACTTGIVEHGAGTFSLKIGRKSIENWLDSVTSAEASEPQKITDDFVMQREAHATIYGKKVSFGKVQYQATMPVEQFTNLVRKALGSKNSKSVTLRFKVDAGRTVYERWAPSSALVSLDHNLPAGKDQPT